MDIYAKPKLPPLNERLLLEAPIEDVLGGGLTVDDFVAAYLVDYNAARALKRMNLWQGREKAAATVIMRRPDVESALSVHQSGADLSDMGAIRAQALQSLYRLALSAESESVRLGAISRLLDVTDNLPKTPVAVDVTDVPDDKVRDALRVLGKAPAL